MKLILFILSLFMCQANADTVFKYGLGVFASAEKSKTEVKFISLGEQHQWVGPFFSQYEAGLWTDTVGNGRRGAGFFGASTGVKVDNPLFIQWSLGIVAISRKDVYLGGIFQINNELTVGLQDEYRNSIGLSYKHLSSAGIFLPNIGRDFLLLRVSIPW